MFRHVCQGKKIDESSQKGVSAVEILRMIEDFKARDPPEKSILGGKGKGGGRKKEEGGFRQTQSNTKLTTKARRRVTPSASCIPKTTPSHQAHNPPPKQIYTPKGGKYCGDPPHDRDWQNLPEGREQILWRSSA